MKSADEPLSFAEQNGVTLTAEEAKCFYAHLHPAAGELSDDELNHVSGGGCGSNNYTFRCAVCGRVYDTGKMNSIDHFTIL